MTKTTTMQQKAVRSMASRWTDSKLRAPQAHEHPHCDLPGCFKLAFVSIRTLSERSSLCFDHYEAVQSAAKELGSKHR